MGIDVYLTGCEHLWRKAENDFFAQLDRNDPEDSAKILRHLNTGRFGRLRSATNSLGFFPILTHIFGFDVAGYLFPGDWGLPVPIDGSGLLSKVQVLKETATLAQKQRTPVPWLVLFAELTGEPAPEPHPDYARICLAAEETDALLTEATGKRTSPPPVPKNTPAELFDFWPMLDELEDFAKLAAEKNANGEVIFVTIVERWIGAWRDSSVPKPELGTEIVN